VDVPDRINADPYEPPVGKISFHENTLFFLESFGLSTSYAASFFTDFQHFQVDASQTSKRLAA
jgi:hypothetical protein